MMLATKSAYLSVVVASIVVISMSVPSIAFVDVPAAQSIHKYPNVFQRSHVNVFRLGGDQWRRTALLSSNDDENNNMNEKKDNCKNNSSSIFDSFFNRFWNSIGSSSESNSTDSSPNMRPDAMIGWQNGRDNNAATANNIDAEDDDDSTTAAGTYVVLNIPAKEVKPGGLRLFLMFYLMGMQNTPQRNTWRANQPGGSSTEYVVDFRYLVDNSAALSIVLGSRSITIYRIGSQPSNSYLMQEALILQGILNELDQCATDDRVQVENRLLILNDDNRDAIHIAKDALSFG